MADQPLIFDGKYCCICLAYMSLTYSQDETPAKKVNSEDDMGNTSPDISDGDDDDLMDNTSKVADDVSKLIDTYNAR